jgi:hypothetical protein
MAEGDGPSIVATAICGWQDTFAAFSRMLLIFGMAIAALCVLNILELTLFPDLARDKTTVGVTVFDLIVFTISSFLLTPLAIAVHRFVLLGEVSDSYSFNLADLRFKRFFLFTVLAYVLTLAPILLMSAAISASGLMSGILGVVFVVVFIIFVILLTRTLILFPAIAVDAPGAEWGNALADTRGHSWVVFFTVSITSIPAVLPQLVVLLVVVAIEGAVPGPGGRIVISLVQSVLGVLSLAAIAAVVSRLYAAFSVRLGRPAGL